MKYIVVTGGAGFIGSNLINSLTAYDKKLKIISIDNYFTGIKKNHIKNKNVKYLRGVTRNISQILSKYKKNTYKIPMIKNSRSLNLSNAVSICIFEAWKQNEFKI